MLAGVVALVHFLGEEIDERVENHREKLVSFGAGVSVTYIFVQLIPEFNRISVFPDRISYIFLLAGFSSLHLLEKLISKHSGSRSELRKEYSEIHSSFFFVYHAAIGYLLALLVSEGFASGLVFFLPIALHSGISSLSMAELHVDITSRLPLKVFLSLAPLFGAALNIYTSMNSFFTPLFGLVIGMFTYIIFRDSIPGGETGRPVEYLAGTILYLAVIITFL